MFEVRARRRRPLRPRRFMCWPAPFARARRATRPAFPAPRSPLPAAPPARTQELVLPDPSAADHLFPPRAPSRREGDDADVRDRRDVAGTTNDVFSNRLPDDDRSSDFTDASDGGTSRGWRSESKTESTTESKTESKTSVSVDVSDRDRFPALRDAALVFWATDDSRVEDWSTCDWMCSKVLGPYARKHPASGDAARACSVGRATRPRRRSRGARRSSLSSTTSTTTISLRQKRPRTRASEAGSSPSSRRPVRRRWASEAGTGTAKARLRSASATRARRPTRRPTRRRGYASARGGCSRCARARRSANRAAIGRRASAREARDARRRRRRAEPVAAFLTLCPYGEKTAYSGGRKRAREARAARRRRWRTRARSQRGSPARCARGSERRRRRGSAAAAEAEWKKKKKTIRPRTETTKTTKGDVVYVAFLSF